MNLTNGVRPPRQGENVVYICHKCQHRFTAKLSFLPLPGLLEKRKCPECGSLKTSRDFGVAY